MATPDRTDPLRVALFNYERISADVQAALLQAEDALTLAEDREARRSQRRAHAAQGAG
jgi:hypothetical protein